MLHLLTALGGYLVGSFPTAFLVVKKHSGIDIRSAGSGNVGGFNTYAVTNSKSAGFVVGIVDGLKGLVVGIVAGWLSAWEFDIQAVAMLGVILGHNYPVWLRFKGGRGLATAAGGLFAIGVWYTVVWCLTWLVSKRATNDILKGNIIAIVLTPIVVALLPERLVALLLFTHVPATRYVQFSFVLSGVLLLSHLRPLRTWLTTSPEHLS